MRPHPQAAPLRRVVARAVTFRFGGTVALRGFDGTFDAGQVTSVEGPNGSGKSTLLGILGTRLHPTSGAVLYDPAPADRSALRAAVGWLGHDAMLYPDLSAE